MRELQLYWTREAEVQPTDDTGKTMTALFGLRPDHLACFYDYAEPIPWQTTEDGVPIITGRQRFRDQRFLALMPVGEAVKDYSSRPVKDGDSLKYPRAWAAYEARNAIGGAHALELLPGIRPYQIMELEALKLYTMELLAASNEDIGELEPLRAAARKFLKPRFRLVGGEMVAA